MKFKNILIATDGLEHTQNAIYAAREFAKSTSSKLHVISVIDTAIITKVGDTAGNLYEELKKVADLAIEDMVKNVTDMEIIKYVVDGKPSEEIIKCVEKNNIDIVIMGTAKKTGLSKFLIGSVSEDVLRKSKIPVLIVPGQIDELGK